MEVNMHLKKSILITAAALCLCACSHSSEAKPCDIGEKYSCDVTVTQNGKQFSAVMTRGAADIWELEFSKPDTVKGLKINLDGPSLSAQFSGLTYRTDRSELSQYSLVSLGCGAVEKLISKDGITCKKEDGRLIEQGTVSGQDFTAEFEDEKLKELTFSDQLRFEFTQR